MTLRVRSLLLGTVACAVMCLSAPVAYGAFVVQSFYAANCKATAEACNKAASPAEELQKAKEEVFTQAAGHPPFGVTDFTIKSHVIQTVPFEAVAPEGNVKAIRTDVAPGVSTNPEAVPKCPVTTAGFVGTELEPVPGLHAFTAPTCPGSEIGTNTVHVVIEVASKVFKNYELTGTVYNLEQPPGFSSYFGVALSLQPVLGVPLYAHTFIEGHVEWASDYHDYFEIKNVTPGLIESRLAFKGNIGTGGFLSNPTSCTGAGPQTTTRLHMESYEGESASTSYTVPVGTEGCLVTGPLAVPFAPTFALMAGAKETQSDQPDGITTELALPHNADPAALDSSQLKSASVTLPEGMTLNPSGAQGLEACTPAQIGIHTTAPVSCPEKSKIADATLNVPGLPAGSLQGSLYLGNTETGPITKQPYTVYLDVESLRYGISVRLRGEVSTDETTGRVTAKFTENPEQPFSNLILHFTGGALAPIANPLVCGTATTNVSFAPFTGTAAVSPEVTPFTVDGNGAGGACASPLPFSLGQATAAVPTSGGSGTNFTLSVTRADGQQYLSKVSAALPLGLVGKIPAVPLCPEPQATLGSCAAESQIGVATTTVGSGPTPARLTGPVYLTGPTGSAPYGMTTVINAAVGPFSLGNVVTRTGIFVDPHTARVTVAGAIPTIFKGIPLRLKALTVSINRQGFLINPTNCGALATDTTLTSSFGATQGLSTAFQATNCSALAFKPKFGATSNAKTSRANGAALVTHINFPSGTQANIKSVRVTVPKQLPSRLTTLKNACLEAVFNANPNSCPSNARVGTARVKTPVLPGQLSGPAFFVSHGGAAFPDLDLVMSGDGVTVILVGNTNISKGVTTTTFASTPDVPFSGFELNLPSGPNSAVAAVGNLCKQSLVMPTTITAQSGNVIKQNTVVAVSACPVIVLSSHTKGNKALVTVKVPASGRVSGGGSNLKTIYKHPGKAQKVTLEVPLTSSRRPLTVRVRVGFIPKAKGQKTSVANATVHFK